MFKSRELRMLVDSTKIEDIVSRYVKLELNKSKTKYYCLCPICEHWHLEVYIQRNTFKCWHCGDCFSGDALNFIQRIEEIDLKQAIARLEELKANPRMKVKWIKTYNDGSKLLYGKIEKAREKQQKSIKRNEVKIAKLQKEISKMEAIKYKIKLLESKNEELESIDIIGELLKSNPQYKGNPL